MSSRFGPPTFFVRKMAGRIFIYVSRPMRGARFYDRVWPASTARIEALRTEHPRRVRDWEW